MSQGNIENFERLLGAKAAKAAKELGLIKKPVKQVKK